MKRIMHLAAASVFLLFVSAGHAAAQPSAEEPVNIWADTFEPSNQMDFVLYTVPANRQLIIDNVSLRSWVPAGEQVIGASMNLPSVHFFVVANQGTTGNRTYYAAAQSTRIVVGANQTIVFRVTRSHHGTNAYAFVALSGRLVKN